MRKWALTVALACLGGSAVAETIELPDRMGVRPRTTDGVPHIQFGLNINKALADELLRRVDAFPGVQLGATRVSLPGAVGFQLDADLPLARGDAIVGGREFAHMHPDGSLHASLEPGLARAAVQAGWAIAHPWANQRAGWGGFVMIYTPRTQTELDVVTLLVEQSYEFVTGQKLTN